jgi:hypothetical protein
MHGQILRTAYVAGVTVVYRQTHEKIRSDEAGEPWRGDPFREFLWPGEKNIIFRPCMALVFGRRTGDA